MPDRYRRSDTPFLTLGVRNSPDRTMRAARSVLRTALLNTRSRPTYSFALGFAPQKLGELTSFQSCQSIIGNLGNQGWVDQNSPLLPYRCTAALTKAANSSLCERSGG